MMMLGKLTENSHHSHGRHLHGPSHSHDAMEPADDDFIRTLDYDDLEQRYDIHKYYPKFIHNYDYLTPQIREMIGDKPVYAKANEHVKNFKNPGARKTYVTEIDVATGQMKVREKKVKEKRREGKEDRTERREDMKERKEERKEKRREDRKERSDERKERRGERKERIEEIGLKQKRVDGAKETDHSEKNEQKARSGEVDHLENPSRELRPDTEERAHQRKLLREHRSQRMAEKTSQPYGAPAIRPPKQTARKPTMEFNNPFDSNQKTLVGSQNCEGLRSRQNSVRTVEMDTKSSIGGKLRNLMRRRSVDASNTLVRTSSYDQTQSTMTTTRGAKNKLLRLKGDSGRRMSGQLGTYIFEELNREEGEEGMKGIRMQDGRGKKRIRNESGIDNPKEGSEMIEKGE